MTTKVIEPKIHLRINPKEILHQHIQGAYYNREVHKSQQKETINYGMAVKFGDSSFDERYMIMGGSGIPIILITTVQHQFTQNFQNIPETANGHRKPSQNKIKICNYCRREFNYDHVGIPVKLDITDYGYNFYCQYIFHSFGCAFTWLCNDPRSRNTIAGNPRYASSESLLKFLFNLIHPDKKLKPSKDWTMLDINNGPLSLEEYDNEQFMYKETSNVIYTTVKSEYMQYSNPL